ncbi:uncharacterized protein LOC116111755 [Pistacia vera]|uniref:uncharacterized protein LOC116111755 n=1 Tax=Pistacia vera TaxID=55513 RepID=UPI00126394FB|nr:uncharacterized protein LOC116111755 [Pistacia vera]
MAKFLSTTETRIQNQEASIKNLKAQIGQLANIISGRQQGHLPSDTERNPNEQCKAITLRDGKVIGEEESQKKAKSEAELPVSIEEKKANSEKETETKVKEIARGKGKALAHMPSYAKFLKDILSNKQKIEEHGTIMLTEECSAILQNKLPPKLRDPGSFTIPCALGDSFFDKALSDLGASINLMPLSIFRKLGLGEVKETNMSLQLADRSTKRPKGIVEDILLKVEKFIFPVDFVVLDMKEDWEVPLILGHPFLATTRALIDMQQGKLILRLSDDEIMFDVHKAMKNLIAFYIESCFHSDSFGGIVGDHREEGLQKDSLERCLMESSTTEDEDPCLREEVEALEKESLTDNNMELKEDLHKTPNEAPKLELKPLPSNLKYVFLDKDAYPVIISASLIDLEEKSLLDILRKHEKVMGWTIADIKGISPSICMHKILMEENFKPTIQPQRRLNPIVQEVVRKEVVKLLDAGIIYPISDSNWVSPMQVMTKKRGMTIVKNENNELIPTRMRCEESNLVLNWEKCHFMVRESIVLGHKISEQGIEVDKAKVEVTEKLPPPTTAFNLLKEKLVIALIVVVPNWNNPFEIMCDASDYAIGAALGQRKDKMFHVISYAIHTLNGPQLNYTTTEK